MPKMQIVLLCGGLGTRLKSISKDIPKSLLKFNGRPFIEYVLKSINRFEPSSIHLCLGYKNELYINYIETIKDSYDITYSIEEQDKLLGTGGAIKNAYKYLDENFIVQYGDTILDFDYKGMYKSHLKSEKMMTMTVLSSDLSNEKPNVKCKRNLDNSLVCIYDKFNSKLNANYIDYGAIAFNRKIFGNFNKLNFDLAHIMTTLCEESKAYFYEVSNPYIEIGTINSYSKAIKILQK